jgi:hypothetical protein
MDARDEDDMRGCDEGMRERLEAEADGADPRLLVGRAGRVVAPPGVWAGSVVAPPGGRAMGCSGLTGRPGWPGYTGGGTTTTPGG